MADETRGRAWLSVRSFLFRKSSDTYFWKQRNKALSAKGPMRYFRRYRYERLMEKWNAGIPLETEIKGMPRLPHGLTGIFVSRLAVIGQGCTIFQQVTIGSNLLAGSAHYGAPVIGDDVYIGVGAKIIGNVTVGDGARIGAGAVVVKDVPPGSTVVPAEPRVILRSKAEKEP